MLLDDVVEDEELDSIEIQEEAVKRRCRSETRTKS